jgi:hypothetical protein
VTSSTRDFGAKSSGPILLVGSGTLLLALGVGLACYQFLQPVTRNDANVLSIVGVAASLLGLWVIALGLRPRRHWVRMDEQGLSQPWAAGRREIKWSEIREFGEDSFGGVWVGSGDGRTRVRIATELDEFQELAARVALRVNENIGRHNGGFWRDGPREISLKEGRIRFVFGQLNGTISIESVRKVTVGIGPGMDLTTMLVTTDGENVLLPHVGKKKAFEVYRTLLGAVHGDSLPVPYIEGKAEVSATLGSQRRRAITRVAVVATCATVGSQLLRQCIRIRR